ncbi:precorrin-6y C5,15-methyltransferase (decarboxylating) subunit CbiE [Leptothoe sp. ISB3NOV94-8A]|uniref:Precorrin-6y C5,15-methyltransferase (Decarboxylating) subunit CbiE n=1 Tax=Adonisia turfae CCMR0081 TaxID=2292702 RepID=A0A6M0RX61_9CYAN|nr:precorrin-6y C5,15-methyltransferase (decarboxylating) subunit CbiE [Adonisia turfae CCMR0081]
MKQSCPQNLLHVIGLGLDGLQSLSPESLACLKKAEIIAGSKAHLQTVAEHPARKLPLSNNIVAWIDQIADILQQQSVVVLASGDPLFYGLGRLLTQRFDRQYLRFYPQVSSIQLAFNRLGIPWQSATIVSVHGRQPDHLEQALKQGKSPLAVLTDFVHTPGEIARLIQDIRPPAQYHMTVCSQLGATEETIQSISIEAAIDSSFPSPNVVVLEAQPLTQALPQPLFGIADKDFHTFPDQPGLITKQEVRALSLSLLRLQPDITVWDVGAGTGSISIEIARLIPDAHIYAIEKTAAGLTLIEKNCRRFGTPHISPIRGVAPAALNSLPDPDRIMIGGGGKAMSEILAVCCDRIRPNGFIVANFATLETCMLAKQQLQNKGWIVQLLQVNIARSATLATATRFVPLNPVILLQASRPFPQPDAGSDQGESNDI